PPLDRLSPRRVDLPSPRCPPPARPPRGLLGQLSPPRGPPLHHPHVRRLPGHPPPPRRPLPTDHLPQPNPLGRARPPLPASPRRAPPRPHPCLAPGDPPQRRALDALAPRRGSRRAHR